jgi:hypothetical protein
MIAGIWVLIQLLFSMLVGQIDWNTNTITNPGAVILAEEAVETSMADYYDLYCYTPSVCRYADFTSVSSYDNPDEVTDIFSSGAGSTAIVNEWIEPEQEIED